MRILDWKELDESARREALARPAPIADLGGFVEEVITSVRQDGDAALRSLTKRFDGVDVANLLVTPAEFSAARHALTAEQVAAIETAIANVERFHVAQMPESMAVETMPGVQCERVIRPISKVGLYVPAGSAPLPSAVVMLAVPARIAGCRRRVLCTAPNREGNANAAVLVAAQLCGIETVFKVGGAQAIAALAYGTESVPKVDKIYGPGGARVTATKQRVANDPGGAACDLPAGPSEVMVIADDSARPEFVAADLLAQAEHDSQAQAILVTSSAALATAVVECVAAQMRQLSRRSILEKSLVASRCIVVQDTPTAIEVANEYAAEHLILEVREPRHWLPQINNAGSIFLGAWTPESMGDYCSGTNHVLPTYGYARAYSGLSVLDFIKHVTVQELTPAGLRALGPVAVTLAQLEGLDAHANAVTRRLAVIATGAVGPARASARPDGSGSPS